MTMAFTVVAYVAFVFARSLVPEPAALRGLAEAMESEQAGDVVYGVEAARALLAERKR